MMIKLGLHIHTIQLVLKSNFQQIPDGEYLPNEIEQKTEVAQRDKLSSLMFNLTIAYLYFELHCRRLYSAKVLFCQAIMFFFVVVF